MNDEQFERAMRYFEGIDERLLASDLRTRDKAQREALARVEAERDRWIANYNHLIEQHMPRTGHGCEEGWSRVVEARELQAQLEEAVGLLRKIQQTEPLLDDRLAILLNAFLARHAQDEQQEAAPLEPGVKPTKAQARAILARQEAQGAQAGDRAEVSDAYWRGWNDRAALATQPAAGELPAKPDSSDTFYAGLYHKSSPMWHQLHELATSKGYDHVRYAIECAPVYKCDCRGARKVGIDLEGRTRPCECVEAANDAAPPAAAHGDEAVRKDAGRYRWLRNNCEDGDLCIAKSDGFSLRSVSGDDPDRYIDAMRAQAGEGGE